VSGHAEDVHVLGCYFHDEQHVQPPEEDGVDMEEVTGQQTVRLGLQECPPGGVLTAGSRRVAGSQDAPDGRCADGIAQLA
jgi:hypothetical protein